MPRRRTYIPVHRQTICALMAKQPILVESRFRGCRPERPVLIASGNDDVVRCEIHLALQWGREPHPSS